MTLNKSELFSAAHAAAKAAVAEQTAIKHPSAHKSYAELFAISLRGAYVLEKSKLYVPVETVKYMFLRGL